MLTHSYFNSRLAHDMISSWNRSKCVRPRPVVTDRTTCGPRYSNVYSTVIIGMSHPLYLAPFPSSSRAQKTTVQRGCGGLGGLSLAAKNSPEESRSQIAEFLWCLLIRVQSLVRCGAGRGSQLEREDHEAPGAADLRALMDTIIMTTRSTFVG
jgi:hypothetical protein